MTSEQNKYWITNLKIFLIVGILYLLLWPIVVVSPIGSSSEAREVHVARVIFETGEWIAPRRAGFAPSKPPLYHWIVTSVGLIIGQVDEKVARSVSLFFGMMLLALTMRLAVALKPKSLKHKNSGLNTALLSGIILLSTYEFLRLCGDTRVDMTFSYFVVSAIAALLWPIARFENGQDSLNVNYKASDLNAFYVACGVGVLAKGPLGLVLPLVIGFCIVSMQIGLLEAIKLFTKPCLGWILFPCIALPWYFLSAAKGGGDFIIRQIIFENLERFSGGEHITREPFWYYIPSFMTSALPWSLFFFVFLYKYIRSANSRLNAPYPNTESNHLLRLLPVAWIVLGLTLFSISAGKRHSYLLPLFPALAIFLSWEFLLWSESFSSQGRHKVSLYLWRFYYSLVAIGLFMAGFVFLIPLIDFTFSALISRALVWLTGHSMYMSGPLLLVILFAVLFFGKQERFLSANGGVLFLPLVAVIGGVAVFTPMAIKNDLKGFYRMAQEINLVLPSQAKIKVIRKREEELLDPLLFYLNRELIVVDPPIASIECGTYYLFQNKYLELFKTYSQGSGKEVFVKGHYQQVVDREQNKNERDIYLVYSDCDT